MATYYGYAERNAEDQIDWNAIGKSMNDTLLAEQKRRDELKAEIDKDSVEFGETLSNYPEGNHQGMVDSSINYASDIQSYQLLQLRLLKSGKIKLRDYIRNRENLVQGTKQYYGIMEKYSAKFDEFMKLKDEGKTGARQAKLLAEVEGFGNLANTRPYINPTTGNISIGKQMLKDPSKPYDAVSNPYTSQMGSKPADFKTTQQLEFSLLGPQMSYDSSVAIDETVAKYKVDYQKLEKSGSSSIKITDITENPNFDASLRNYYNSYFEANPNNAADFLTDFIMRRDVNGIGVPIDYVDDPSNLLADPTKPYNKETNPYVGLMMKPDPAQPGGGRMIADMDSESGKELKDFGFEKFKETVEAQLKKEIEYQRGYQPRAPRGGSGPTEQELSDFYQRERQKIFNTVTLPSGESKQVISRNNMFEFGAKMNVPITEEVIKDALTFDRARRELGYEGTREEWIKSGGEDETIPTKVIKIGDVTLERYADNTEILQALESQVSTANLKAAKIKLGSQAEGGNSMEIFN